MNRPVCCDCVNGQKKVPEQDVADADVHSSPEDDGRGQRRDEDERITNDRQNRDRKPRRSQWDDDDADYRRADSDRDYDADDHEMGRPVTRRRFYDDRYDYDEAPRRALRDRGERRPRPDDRADYRYDDDRSDRRYEDDAPRRRPPAADADRGEGRSQPQRQDKSDESDDGKNAGGKDEGGKDKQQGKRRWPLIVLAVVVVLAVIGGVGYWWLTRNQESTVDAYTEGNAVSFASKVTGYVTQLNVDDNTFVHKGDLLLKIDPRDYIAARDQAQAALDLAKSQLSSAQVSLEVTKVSAPANLEQAKAQLQQVQANRFNAQRDYNRLRAVDPRATTQSNIDQATASLRAQDAQVQAAQAQVTTASLVQQTIKTAEDTVKQRQAQVEQAEANLEAANVNLSYCELTAPDDGYITNRNVNMGTFLQAGQQVFYIVRPQVWIVANFKEDQLDRMRPGQRVTINVDAYPDLDLKGHVDSIQQGSGARFSAFPAENATGNFVKIVRRVPVKILIDSGLPQGDSILPLGLSVEPTVYLK